MGGGHTNSGVNNKAAYLMVDGDTFNGKTISGIGIEKMAKIYYEAQSNILTSGSTYLDLYNALDAGCNALIGTHGITATDCSSVVNATDAVEMNLPPCTAIPAPICPAGTDPNYILNESFENGIGNWTHTTNLGPDAWSLGSSFPNTGIQHLHGDNANVESDSNIRGSLNLNIPPNAYMHFSHVADLEAFYDGGIVEYSTDNGATWNDTDNMFTHNGYHQILSSGNPLGARSAFSGDNTGMYNSSRIDLSTLSGTTASFRFRIGTDQSVGMSSWNIDDVKIYTCGDPSPEISSPPPGSSLSSSTETFSWINNDIAVTRWQLFLGSSVGAKDYYDSGSLPFSITSSSVSNLPTDGGIIHARLWFKVNNAWVSKDYTYSALSILPPAISSPVSGSTLSSSTQSFSWSNNGSNVSRWQLQIGNSPGKNNYFDSASIPASTTIETVFGLPTDGSTIYVRLWYKIDGSWLHTDYVYTAITIEPRIISPTPDSTLSSINHSFNWTNDGLDISEWLLYVGSNIGLKDYHDSGKLNSGVTESYVTNLPNDGSPIHARLFYKVAGSNSWLSSDFTYTAVTIEPSIYSPNPGDTLNSGSYYFYFTNNGLNVTDWWLNVGSSLGTNDIFDSGSLDANTTSQNITGLPGDGSTIHVRLWYKIAGGNWQRLDYTYTAASIEPEMTSPTPGSTLYSGSQYFNYSDHGLDVTEWWLQVGSSLGGHDIFDSGSLDANTTSQNITGLPGDGSTIHARLWYKIAGGNWQRKDYTYTAASIEPEMTYPSPGSTLYSGSQYFDYSDHGLDVTEWWLQVGSSLGGHDIFDSGSLDANTTSQNITGLPGDGSTIHVRLWYKIAGGNWQRKDYTYTTATIEPQLSSPNNILIQNSEESFFWTNQGLNVTNWWLYVGSAPGLKDIYDSGSLGPSITNQFVTGLPTDGSTIYVSLWYKFSSNWNHKDYSFTSSNPNGTAAPICPSNTSPSYLVEEGFENGLGAWTHSANIGPDAWSLSNAFPASGSNHLHGIDSNTNSDSYIESNLSLTLPPNAYLHFTHQYNFESNLDGGIVEYTGDNGTTWQSVRELFTHNGYTNPTFNTILPGGAMFSGNYNAQYNSSRINLNALSGSTLDLRFRIGTDGSIGNTGWFIDDVLIYTCN